METKRNIRLIVNEKGRSSNGEKLTRMFIAIDFPDEVVKEITRVQEEFSKLNFQGKLTEAENLHLTLKFLGEIDDKKLERAREKLREIKFGEIDAKIGEVGLFNFRGNPKIAWIKINGKGIFELQKKIDLALKDLFSAEERFMSHLTIARIKYVKDKKGFYDKIKNIKTKEVKFKINNFKLKSSELRTNGPVYRDIETFEAGKY